MSRRKDYKPIPDDKLDRLKADTRLLLGTLGQLSLPAKTVYWLVMEVIDSREEIFRLQLCETVDQIIANELDDDEEDHLAIQWPDDPYLASDMQSVYKPAVPWERTVKLPRPPALPKLSPDDFGRRIPRKGL